MSGASAASGWTGAVALDGDAVALAPARDGLEDLAAAPAQRGLVQPADLGEPLAGLGPALGDLDERRVLQDRGDRAVAALGQALAPLHELARDRALARVERVHAREPPEDRVEVSLVADALQVGAFLARPLEPPDRAQAVLQRFGEREELQHVLARVLELLGAERAAVPAREARGLAQPHVEYLAQQPLVAELGAHAREPGGDLRVEHVVDLAAPQPAQERNVLAAGMQDDLDRRVGEHLGQRRGVERIVGERVQQRDVAALGVVAGQRHLDQAELRR